MPFHVNSRRRCALYEALCMHRSYYNTLSSLPALAGDPGAFDKPLFVMQLSLSASSRALLSLAYLPGCGIPC